MLKSKSKILMSLSVVVVIAVITGILLYPQNATGNQITPITSITMNNDYPVAVDLTQMADEAELIVVGKYTGFNSSWNMARNPDDISKEDSENYVEGWLYNFVIDDVLKGHSDSNTILVNHRYSEILKKIESNAVVDKEGNILAEATKTNEISLSVHDPLFIEPDLETTYILFLLKDHHFGDYYGAIEPFAIKVINGTAALQSNLIDNTDGFAESVDVNDNRTVNILIDVGLSINDTVSGKSLDDIIQTILSNNDE